MVHLDDNPLVRSVVLAGLARPLLDPPLTLILRLLRLQAPPDPALVHLLTQIHSKSKWSVKSCPDLSDIDLLVLDGGVRDPHDLPVGHVHLHRGLGVPQGGALSPLLIVIVLNKEPFQWSSGISRIVI